MFYYLEGTVAAIETGLCVVDCNGVGYACHVSQNVTSKAHTGEKIKLYTYLHVREDIFDLYGFLEQEEKSCFQMLIGVSGVGPKAALAILSVAPASQLALAIITGDEKLLTQAPGIGKKIAQRIVLELQDKMKKEQQGMVTPLVQQKNVGVNHTQEAVAALMVLGYGQAEVLQALNGLAPEQCEDAESIIRAGLKALAGM